MNHISIHSFHIPVMGLAYTIDSPVKVARFGINSVVSIVEDRLIEMMRQYYCEKFNWPFTAITTKEIDYRKKRITDYLNLLNKIVTEQVETLRKLPFTKGSEIVKYFEMLPPASMLRKMYTQYRECINAEEKNKIEANLRNNIRPGRIDVNIMTKTDKDNFDKNNVEIKDGSDAVSALAGYVESDVKNSSVIFSAGLNPRLFNYLAKQSTFDPDENGLFSKEVTIKVSDFRSAMIQGMFLAKKGIWVSEFRIESGLNCGGHAFATAGKLIGTILQEFKDRREELLQSNFAAYNKVLQAKKGYCFKYPPRQLITYQGGLGTNEEREMLREKYGIDSTGWGTPFLLVPEATTVDEISLHKLMTASNECVALSDVSPLGVKFYYLKNSSAEIEKQTRILSGKPGSPCTEKHLSFNTEFTEQPICTASAKYQRLKLKQLEVEERDPDLLIKKKKEVLEKECLCIGLSNSAATVYDRTFIKNIKGITICPGPNIAWFNKVVSLKTMVDHIYGRENIIDAQDRPHFFINELTLYVNYLEKEISAAGQMLPAKAKYFSEFAANLLSGIEYYHQIFGEDVLNSILCRECLLHERERVNQITAMTGFVMAPEA